MKKLISALVSSLFALSLTAAATTHLKVSHLTVKGMTCSSCAKKIGRKLQGIDGVREAKVNHETGDVTVKYDEGKVAPQKMADAVKELGYEATVASGG
jgi:Cu+-exporting ATPase